MEKLQKLVVDCSTGVQEIVDLTDEEIAQMEADAQTYAEQKAVEEALKTEVEAKKVSGRSKLKELGLTDAEIDAITK